MLAETSAHPQVGSSIEFVFEDMFAQDAGEFQRLNEIARDIRLSDRPKSFEFNVQADADQRRFIDCPSSLIRLIAPAGCGKTQSIVNRVLTRVSRGESLRSFLMLTFDNSAGLSLAEKFRNGLTSLKIPTSEMPQVMTLNKFGYGLFRTVLSDKYGKFRIGENVVSDQREAVRRSLEELRVSNPAVYGLLPRKLGYRVYWELFSTFKNSLLLPDGIFATSRQRYVDWCREREVLGPWLADTAADSPEALPILNALANLYRHYCRVMASHGKIDFDDQKLLPYLALAENEKLAKAVSGQFQHIVVDEFQDINLLDFEFIRLIARGKNLVVVGDDDQAIYAFRGCSPDYILRFPELMSAAVETHVLNVNYRCPKNIMEMSHRLIQHNVHRISKTPIAARQTDADVKLWHCLNSASEAQIVARTIKRIYTELSVSGFRYSDVAILVRMNSQSLPLQMALIREEIPYHCRKQDNVIVSDTMERLLGLIRLHLNLVDDPMYFSRVESKLLCESYFQYAHDQQVDFFHRLVEQAGNYREGVLAASRKAGDKFKAGFVSAVESLFAKSQPADLVKTIAVKFKNLGGIVGTLEDALNDSLPLGELVDIAGRFRGDTRQFHEMVSDLLVKVQGGLFHGEEGDAVNLLTYFKAKGRQWHSVFIPGVNQKVVPHSRSKIEDERRLFYVAVTRATHNLLLSYVRQAVRVQVEPSQFLNEMGLGKGDEKRAKMIGTTGLDIVTPAETRPAPPLIAQPAIASVQLDSALELIEMLDEAVFPAVAGTPARGARRRRLDQWQQAITNSVTDPKAIFEALASCDSGIRTGNDGRRVKLAVDRWWKARSKHS